MRTSALALLAACTFLSTTAGCSGCCPTGALAGPINDPSNRALRRDILTQGLGEFCKEMLQRTAPLQLQQGAPAIGRFFPTQCNQVPLPNGDLYVQMSGVGYAWTNLSKRVSFDMQGTITYDPDFLLDGCTAYAYFRTRQVQGSNFNVRMIEQPVANMLNQLSPMASQFGQQLVNAQLAQGFTVIREGNGNTDFGLGMIPKGQRPVHPFELHGSNRFLYESSQVEIHTGQRDFVGPIVVRDNNRALYVTARLDGLPAIDVLALRREDAEPWRDQYLRDALPAPLAPGVQPLVAPMGEVIAMNMAYQRKIPVQPGAYYVVFDNTPSAGQAAPPPQVLLSDPAAAVSFSVEIGDN